METIARTYLRNARHLYMRWGAFGKVKRLEVRYPGLREPTNGAFSPSLEQVDVIALAKASQAISSELELGKLIERLLVIALGASLHNRYARSGKWLGRLHPVRRMAPVASAESARRDTRGLAQSMILKQR